MKTFGLCIFFLFAASLIGCEKPKGSEPQYQQLSESAQIIYNSLMEAYNDSCDSCLKTILDKWNLTYEPDSNIPDSLLDVYGVFEETYTPWDLGRMSESEWGDNIYNGTSYCIVQTSIKYGFHYNELVDESLTINDFKPTISNDTMNVLYYTNDYKSALSSFLGTDYVPVGSSNSKENVIVVKPIPQDQYLLRLNFLNNFLIVSGSNWWQIETDPEIYQISFTEGKDKARVIFNLIYENGEVYLEKENDQWNIVDYIMRGIS